VQCADAFDLLENKSVVVERSQGNDVVRIDVFIKEALFVKSVA